VFVSVTNAAEKVLEHRLQPMEKKSQCDAE